MEIIRKTEAWLLDIIFPKSCLGCGKGSLFLCENCSLSLEQVSFQLCPVCEKAITIAGEKCDLCKRSSAHKIDKLIVAGRYDDPLLSRLIHAYKYKFIEELSVPLGDFMLRSLKKWSFPIPDLIVPVPLHRKRLKWRGFNQAELLAEYLGSNIVPGLTIPVAANLLIRTKNTIPQMKIRKYKQRINNISQAFEAKHPAEYRLGSKNILLVDDVCTTGSTIFECAKIISRTKPRTITAAVIARQQF